MNKFLLSIAILSLAGCSAESKIVNIKAKGSLEPNKPLSCVPASQLNNSHTPADIFTAIEKCIQSKDYEKVSSLLFVASSYGKYDSLRVKDKGAHQALSVMKFKIMSSLKKEEQEKLKQSLKLAKSEPTFRQKNCDILKTLGTPNYSPDYMLNHGMSKFTGQGGGLAENFESNSAWDNVVNKYAKCNV